MKSTSSTKDGLKQETQVDANGFEALLAKVGAAGALKPTAKQGVAEFLLLQVKDEDIAGVQMNLAQAIEAIMNTRGAILSVCGSFVLACFGFPFEELTEARDYRYQSATRLVQSLGSSVRVVHGSRSAKADFVGTPHYTSYGPILTDFGSALAILLSMSFGAQREV